MNSKADKPIEDSPQDNIFKSLMQDGNKRKNFIRYFEILLAVLLVFLMLSFFTSIDQTLTITGQVKPFNNIAEIKHETGGEVLDIFIDDYQHVDAGQKLLTLDNNKILTSLKQNESKLRVVDTEIIHAVAYLKNNIKNVKQTEIYKEVEQYLNNIDDTMSHSKQFAEASRLISDHKDEVIHEQIKKNEIDIKRLKTDLVSLNSKLIYIDEQRQIFKSLLESKNVSKIRAIDFEVKYIDLVRDIEKATSDLDMKIRENIGLESKRIVSEQDGIKEKYEQLVKLNKEKIDLVSNIAQLDNMLSNLNITSPISGTVQGLKVFKGIKIQPGEIVVSIIPDNARVVFEAKADLMQKGKISFNNSISVQFDGFNILEFNRVPAKIINVSPYTFDDEVTRDKFFKVLLQLDATSIKSKEEVYNIKPGMSGIAYVNSGKRSLFSYMFGPIYNSFYNAYNEK